MVENCGACVAGGGAVCAKVESGRLKAMHVAYNFEKKGFTVGSSLFLLQEKARSFCRRTGGAVIPAPSGDDQNLTTSDIEKPAKARLTSIRMLDKRNHRRVIPYSTSSSSLSWSDLHRATNCSRIDTAITMAAMIDETVHSPGNSKSK